MASKKYRLNKDDGKKIVKGAGIAAGGAVLVYLLSTLPQVDFGSSTPLVVALASILLNSARKWLQDNK